MNEFYQRLTADAVKIMEDREALVELRKKILTELDLIGTRIQVLDARLEENYSHQEKYWPASIGSGNPPDQSELTYSSNVIKEFYANPDLTMVALAKLTRKKPGTVHSILHQHFSQKLDNIQPSQ